MNKITLMPQVVVYQDVFTNDELNLLLNQIHESQKDMPEVDHLNPEESAYWDNHGPQPQPRGDNSLIYTWTQWYTFGMKSAWGWPVDLVRDKKEHLIGSKILRKSIEKVHADYLNDWRYNGRWTYDIDHWDISAPEDEDANVMTLSHLEILQHRLNLESNYTIGVHTDWHDQRKEEPGPKQILTYTIYLNDDYEGGEVDFVDENTNELFVYKPKKGDITVFPAGRPFWHGARAVKSKPDKIFIRGFAIHRFPGSKRWNIGIKSHGAKKWIDLENERIKNIVDAGEVGRQIVYKNEKINKGAKNPPLFIESEYYIDGRVVKEYRKEDYKNVKR